MKKTFTSIIICLVTAILLSACSATGFTKRRYTKGHYISHQQARHNTQANPAPEKSAQQVAPVATVKNNESATAAENRVSFAEPTIKSGKVAQAISLVKHTTNAKHYAKNGVSTGPLDLRVKESFKSSHATLSAAKSAASDDDALSLFWIVIVVILILWLLGVLTGGWGLGGLINLLLVIALVLLILWLLRVL